jgi:hypothetical protein
VSRNAGAMPASETAGTVLSAVLGLLLLTAGVLGPLVTGRVRLHLSDDAITHYVGGEVVTMVLALVLLGTAPAWSTTRTWVPAIAAGAAAYVIYTFTTVVAGQEYGRYPGNAEKAFLLYAAITAPAVDPSARRLLPDRPVQ